MCESFKASVFKGSQTLLCSFPRRQTPGFSGGTNWLGGGGGRGEVYRIERERDLPGQNCVYDPLHPGSSGLQAHLSAVLQSGSAERGGKESQEAAAWISVTDSGY